MKNPETTNKSNIKSMTMVELIEHLHAKVDEFNEATGTSELIAIKTEIKATADQYNEMSKFVAYSAALKTEMPLVSIIKGHHYETRSVTYKPGTEVKDGKTIVREFASVKDGTRNVDMFDFIKFAEERNKQVTAVSTANWKTVLNAQRKKLNNEFKKAVESDKGYTVSKTTANNVLQAVYDALVFIAGESGKNAVFPNKDCKNIIIACAAEYKEAIVDGDVDVSLNFFKDKHWKSIIQSTLYIVLSKKSLTYTYGDPEVDEDAAEVKPKTNPTTKDKTETKSEAKK